MIRQGKLCKYCTGKTCKDIPTEFEPIEIECPACHGDGCDKCNDGEFRLEQCPNKYCSDMYDPITLFELFAKGLPPITGGVLDQSAWFINAEQYFRQQEQLAKADK